MENEDITTVIKVLGKGTHSLDFDLFSHALYSQGILDQGQYMYIKHEFEQLSGCDNDLCIQRILRLISFEQMISVLRFIGLEDLAVDICEQRLPLAIKSDSVSEMPNAVVLYSDYTALSIKRDNCIQQINMEVDFENMTSFLISKLQFKNSMHSRQMALDKLAVVVGIRHFIFNNISDIRAVLSELKSIKECNPDLDQRLSTAFYLKTSIYLNVKANDFGMAETCLVELKQLCFHNGPNWLKVMVFMTEQFLYRRKNYIENDKVLFNKSIEACDRGIACSLSSEETDICFKGNFLQLSKVMTLLSLGKDFSMVKTKDLCSEHNMFAKAILASIKRNYGQLYNREKFIYRLCLARLHENDNPRLALANAKLARDINTCVFISKAEKDNLVSYVNHLQEQVDT